MCALDAMDKDETSKATQTPVVFLERGPTSTARARKYWLLAQLQPAVAQAAGIDAAADAWAELRPVFEQLSLLRLHQLACAPESFLSELRRACFKAAADHICEGLAAQFGAQIAWADARDALASLPLSESGLRDLTTFARLAACDGALEPDFHETHKRAQALWGIAKLRPQIEPKLAQLGQRRRCFRRATI